MTKTLVAGRCVFLGAFMAATLSAPAQEQTNFESGLYRIDSGRYIECCGFAGPLSRTLPYVDQGYLHLKVGAGPAELIFLAEDAQTPFRLGAPGEPRGFTFHFTNGVISSDRIQFVQFASPQPGQPTWNYQVTRSGQSILVQGSVSIPCVGCADVPTSFQHTNVLASLATPSDVKLDRVEKDAASFRFHFTGEPPYDYTVERTESLSAPNWVAEATYRAKIQAIDITVTNTIVQNSSRFFRVRKTPCYCR